MNGVGQNTPEQREVGIQMALSAIAMVLLSVVCGAQGDSRPPGVAVLATDSFSIEVGADARVTHFLDTASGTDYCDQKAGMPFASVKTTAGDFPATSASCENGLLTLGFSGAGGRAVLRVTPGPKRLEFEVVSLDCLDAKTLAFARVPLTLQGRIGEPFGVSPLALNLQTNCQEIPGLSQGLNGFLACERFGFVGARGAIVAGPTDALRGALQDAVKSSPDLAWSPLGGPWALDAKINQGSYLITGEACVTEEDVGGWIDAARALGASQIDFHGGKAFRWGDFEVNKAMYPRGRDSLKAVVDAVHGAGLAAGLHTYAFFIAKDAPWVTPVPDPRLDSDATFTLSADITEGDAAVQVDESTETMSAVTGFQVRNSATLRIDDELITYAAAGRQAPFAFTGCIRGAYGTRAAPHARGAKIHHLKECYGLFAPQGDSDLFSEVAQKTAELYNACGFDMLYLDALDGADILAGGNHAWHYAAKFAYEVTRRLDKPAVMEMSAFYHHLWTVRSRMEAWDCPARAVKDFADLHVLRNLRWKSAFLPTHMGWWGTFDWYGVQPERSLPDELEYVCAKALATDSSLSYIVGFTPVTLAREYPRRLAALAKRYEDLRKAGTVPESIKAQLAAPDSDFTLEVKEDGNGLFRPVAYLKQKLSVTKQPERLVVGNPHARQPLQLRMEALLSAEPFDSETSTVIAALREAGEFTKARTQQGVTATLEPAAQGQTDGGIGMVLTAQNTDVESDRAWAEFRKDFPMPVDVENKGLGLWVEGDGQGEVLNVQVRSPKHLAAGLADHYIPIDFTGKRYFELVEPESKELSRYEWSHTRRKSDWAKDPSGMAPLAYPMYHIWVAYSQIGSLTIGINNLPKGRPVKVGLGTVKAVPLRKTKLMHPAVTVGASTLTFPVEFESGCYLEYLAPDNCKVYDVGGQCIGNVTPSGAAPVLEPGDNVLEFGQSGEPARARVTVISRGEPLQPQGTGGKGMEAGQ